MLHLILWAESGTYVGNIRMLEIGEAVMQVSVPAYTVPCRTRARKDA
jgi:hypothetical protein